MQDTLLSLHRKPASYDPARPFLPWLAAIARYRWVDHLRKVYRADETELDDSFAAQSDEPGISARISLERLFTHLPLAQVAAVDLAGWKCLVMGITLGLGVGAILSLLLRRGAPTSPERAGLLTGIAAGSAGIFAFSLHCPHNDIVHIGLWHASAVVVSAVAGRWIIPALVRW